MSPSSSVLYVETNYLWAIATGRDPDAVGLLKSPPAGLCLAIPQVCIMEAFSVLNATRRKRNQFRNTLDQQISEMSRDTTSPHARKLLALLEQARIANDDLMEEINSRLSESMHLVAQQARLIGLDGNMLTESRQSILITDPTDNLILHCILAHARSNSFTSKILLTENRKDFDGESARIESAKVGLVSFFSKTEHFLNWLRSQPPA